MLKVAICWSGYSGYLAACWRALSEMDDRFELSIYLEPTKRPFSPSILDGLPARILQDNLWNKPQEFADILAQDIPDVVFFSGWMCKGFSALPFDRRFRQTKFVMVVDSAWRGTLRQFLAPLLLRRLLRRTDAIIVAGERGRQYARYLGFSASKIFSSTYGFDYDGFHLAAMRRDRQNHPKSFIFIGRYASEKGVKSMLEAYRQYRARHENPWPLHCYGNGPLQKDIATGKGVEDRGFIQPAELPQLLESEGVFILPSSYEPWGVVVAEAAAAGLPIICSDACCSGLDIVRHLYNGLIYAADDVDALCRCMTWAHQNYEMLSIMGRRGEIYAEAYSAQNWAERWWWVVQSITAPKLVREEALFSQCADASRYRPHHSRSLSD